jgi:hypothetical protein
MKHYRVLAEQTIIFEQYVDAENEQDAKEQALCEADWVEWNTQGHEDQITIINVEIEED